MRPPVPLAPTRAGSLLAVLSTLALCACAASVDGRSSVRPSGWHVVERVGEARFTAAGVSGWAPVMAAREVPNASTIRTGYGGRLILARPDLQIIAGTATRLALPGETGDRRLHQEAGRVRYRAGTAITPALEVATPNLVVSVSGAVLDIAVGPSGTEVEVRRGKARITTVDGRYGAALLEGERARGRDHEAEPLLVSHAPGAAFEPAAPLVLPASKPAAGERGDPGDGDASTSATATPVSVPAATALKPPMTTGASAAAEGVAAQAPKMAAEPAVARQTGAVQAKLASPDVAADAAETGAEPASVARGKHDHTPSPAVEAAPPSANDEQARAEAPGARDVDEVILPASYSPPAGAGSAPVTAQPVPPPEASQASAQAPVREPLQLAQPTVTDRVRSVDDERQDLFHRLSEGLLDDLPAEPLARDRSP